MTPIIKRMKMNRTSKMDIIYLKITRDDPLIDAHIVYCLDICV